MAEQLANVTWAVYQAADTTVIGKHSHWTAEASSAFDGKSQNQMSVLLFVIMPHSGKVYQRQAGTCCGESTDQM